MSKARYKHKYNILAEINGSHSGYYNVDFVLGFAG
jgi:hypothetical protein